MKGISHLFAKATVLYCIAFATLASGYALLKQGQGMSMEGVLGIILGFFGGELLLLCLKTILKKSPAADFENNMTEENDDENSVQ